MAGFSTRSLPDVPIERWTIFTFSYLSLSNYNSCFKNRIDISCSCHVIIVKFCFWIKHLTIIDYLGNMLKNRGSTITCLIYSNSPHLPWCYNLDFFPQWLSVYLLGNNYNWSMPNMVILCPGKNMLLSLGQCDIRTERLLKNISPLMKREGFMRSRAACSLPSCFKHCHVKIWCMKLLQPPYAIRDRPRESHISRHVRRWNIIII